MKWTWVDVVVHNILALEYSQFIAGLLKYGQYWE